MLEPAPVAICFRNCASRKHPRGQGGDQGRRLEPAIALGTSDIVTAERCARRVSGADVAARTDRVDLVADGRTALEILVEHRSLLRFLEFRDPARMRPPHQATESAAMPSRGRMRSAPCCHRERRGLEQSRAVRGMAHCPASPTSSTSMPPDIARQETRAVQSAECS